MSVQEKIRLVREAKGWTQEVVAEKLEMSVNGYGDIERGDTDIKLSKLQKIADLFNIKLSELIELNEKGILNLGYKQTNFQWNITSSSDESQQLKLELEKSQLMNEHKDKEITMLKHEIEQSNKIILLLENK
jgi:transcriptional regulator with XRE-family HTH domain